MLKVPFSPLEGNQKKHTAVLGVRYSDAWVSLNDTLCLLGPLESGNMPCKGTFIVGHQGPAFGSQKSRGEVGKI